ncbi:hypothetical protein [Streptomyces lydicus]|uniref:hypothetical protein n=1 Tax=Streptomyces lydicus TaxID=47763 RepID=UPI0037BDF1B3
MTAPTTTQPQSTDELIADLAANLDQFGTNERISPFTVTNLYPGTGYTRASNALRALHDAGLIHQTTRHAVYALRPDLPTCGNGYVRLRVTNRGSAPVEVIADQPCPTGSREADEQFVRWTCHGCGHGHLSGWFMHVTRHALKHADECRGQALTS